MKIGVNLVLLIASFASIECLAHSYLKKVDMMSGKNSATAPSLKLEFTAPIETKFSQFEIVETSGKKSMSLKTSASENRTENLLLSLPTDIRGEFVLKWNILSSDGHRQRGQKKMRIENGEPSH